jgi:nicotinamidase-related amidase
MSRGLLLIDIQGDYFPGGAHTLAGAEQAAQQAHRLLEHFRAEGDPVVHLRHVWDAPDATFMRPGTAGVEIHPLVVPQDDEPVLTKSEPNGFLGTELESTLRDQGADELVVAGMMSNMCVDSTVRTAADLGFAVTVAHDSCAAAELTFGAVTVPDKAVHAAFMAALADGFASVVATVSVIEP